MLLPKGFEQCAKRYDSYSYVQQYISEQLWRAAIWPYWQKYHAISTMRPLALMDVGSGTGWVPSWVERNIEKQSLDKNNRTIWMLLDRAHAMLATGKQKEQVNFEKMTLLKRHWIQADMHALPLVKSSIDLGYSNLALQWSDVPEKLLQHWYELLAPGGACCVSSLLPGTLIELESCYKYLGMDADTHLLRYVPLAHYHSMLNRIIGVSGQYRLMHYGFVARYEHVYAFLSSITRIGAILPDAARHTYSDMKRLINRYQSLYNSDLFAINRSEVWASWQVLIVVMEKNKI
jgi:ubiquinone/menaquinone biosynthesis C-methylase UbiE